MSITAASLIARISVDGAESATAKLIGVGDASESAGLKLSKLAVGATLIAGAALVGLGAISVKMAGDFQQSTSQLVTSAGESRKNIDAVRTGILQMSVDTATSWQQLSAGMFNVESAGYHLANGGLKVLQAAAEGARAENADLASVTDVLTTAMHNLHLSADQAVPVMNSLIMTVADGKMHMNDLAGALKNVLPVSSALKVHLSDVEGALSTMAESGDKGTAAGTHLAMMFKMLSNPVGAASKEMKAMGIDSIKLAQTMQTSLPDALKMIEDAVAKHFTPGSVQYQRAIQTILGGSKSGIAGLEIMGKSFKDLEKNTKDAAEALRKGGKDVENWDIIQKNFNFQLDAAKNAVDALFIKVGTALLPKLSELLATTTPLIQSFTDWATSGHALNDVMTLFNQNTQTLVPILSGLGAVLLAAVIPTIVMLAGSVIAATWPFIALGVAVGGLAALLLQFHPEVTTISGAFQVMWPIIQNTGIALTVFFTPALIKAGIEAVVSAAKITYNFVASLILTGAEGWAAAGKLAVFIAQMIVVGAQAVINAAKITFSFVASLIATGVQAYVAAYAVSGSFVPALGMVGMQAVAAGGKLLVSLIPALGATDVALSATGVAATVALGPLGLLIAIVGVASLAFVAMKNKSDEMNLGVSGAFDTMGNKVQRSTGRIIATADQMKNGVSNSTNTMKKNVTASFDSMNFWIRHDSGEMSDTAKRLFGKLVKDVSGDFSTLEQNTKDYWNAIADYIDNKSALAAQDAQRHFDSIHMPNLTGGQVGTLLHLNASGTTAGGNAEGTDNWRGGLSWVGEKGPELLNIPSGAQIIPNNKIGSVGSAPVIHNHIDVYLDGSRMTGQLMPRIVQQIRDRTGARF